MTCNVIVVNQEVLKVVEVLDSSATIVEVCRPNGMNGQPYIFKELDDDYTLPNRESGFYYQNTDADVMIEIDFSAVTPKRIYNFDVTNAFGFKLLSTGVMYLSGQLVTGNLKSTMVGSSISAIVMSADTIFLQDVEGGWSDDS